MKTRIGIAHQTVLAGDAIGADVTGAYRLLERCGFEPVILCEHAHPQVVADFRVRVGTEPKADDLAMLLYHHSIHWPAGEALLAAYHGRIVVKYHNITPADFFAPYAEQYRERCAEGREQTGRMARDARIALWQADSGFNSRELEALGVPHERRTVVPPFNRIDAAFRMAHRAVYAPRGPFVATFIGRRAPNKGHAHLLRTVAAWRDLYPEARLELRVIGAVDAALEPYYEELRALESSLRIGDRVHWLGHCDDAQIAATLCDSHVYLNLSEHEGFCVPLVEAQAMGLPVVTTDATALADTAGPGQFVVGVPKSQADYDLIAGLVHEVCTSLRVRQWVVAAGCRNAFSRFTAEEVEAAFLNSLEPVLRGLAA